MKKNILIIAGSPRKGGNSEMLANAFARGASSKGHIATIFNAAAKNISGCKACDACWTKGRACSFIDGFTELEPLLEQADAVVFSSPLYWFSFSTQIKAAIDKMNAYDSNMTLRPLKVEESALLICGAGEDRGIFDGVVATYSNMLKYLRWKNMGVLAVPGVQKKGEVPESALKRAEQLGMTF